MPRAENVKADALLKLVALLPFDFWKETYFEILKQLSLKEPQLVQQINEKLS